MAAPSSPPGTLPPEYRKRLIQGVVCWLVAAACVGGWLAMKAPDTLKDVYARTPHATAPVKTVYLTPQITDAAPVAFGKGDEGSAAIVAGKGAYITLVMTDLGLSEDETKRALVDLPGAVALAFSPYSDLAGWIAKAREAKHEALVLVPMEPASYPKNDPGPKALLTRLSAKENADLLAAILRQSNGAVGVMNFMGALFMKDKKSLAPVFETLEKAGALFVEDRKSPDTAGPETAKAANLPYLASDVTVDVTATEVDVAQKLVELEKLARQRGYAVGIASPYPVSFNMIKSWASDLGARGVTLIPVTAMMKVQARSGEK